MQVLMYIHPGYPELYNNLLSKISDYEVFSETHLQEIVKKYHVAGKSTFDDFYLYLFLDIFFCANAFQSLFNSIPALKFAFFYWKPIWLEEHSQIF